MAAITDVSGDGRDTQSRFEELQRKLVPLWQSIRTFNPEEQTIVVVPSVTIEKFNQPAAEIRAVEERFLFLLFLLRQPRARMIYVTAQPIDELIIDYYLHLLPGVISSHARPRLFNPSPLDGSSRPLTEKLLERPRLLEHIRSLIPDADRAHLVPFNTTEIERDLAVALGIPMYGADPKHFALGTKTGCRRLFAEEGVEHPLGEEDLFSLDDTVAAVARMRATKPGIAEVLVKLNEGVSGEGNALVDLTGMPPAGAEDEGAAIRERLHAMRLEAEGVALDTYVHQLETIGAVVEERISGEDFRSPSVQLRVTPLGEVELLSTHDQLLGGASGQTYLGAKFPADPAYAALITREAAKVGHRLAEEGVVGRFALDFVVVRRGEEWLAYAIELNLRKGGTTHPFLTLQFLTDGTYDPDKAIFNAPSGRPKYFVASDKVSSPRYRGLTPRDLFDIVVRHGLHFDQSRQTGVVFHMMSALPELGRVGLTAVGDSPEEAEALYARTIEILDEETSEAFRPR